MRQSDQCLDKLDSGASFVAEDGRSFCAIKKDIEKLFDPSYLTGVFPKQDPVTPV